MSSLCACFKSLAIGFSWYLLTSGWKQCQRGISKCVAEEKWDGKFTVYQQEKWYRSQVVWELLRFEGGQEKEDEIWGMRTLSTSSKHVLVLETRAECQEAQQVLAGSLCQNFKKSSKRKLFHFLSNKRKLYPPSPTTYRMGQKLFHNIKNRKAKAFYAHIIWKALLIFSRKTLFGWIPAGTAAWGCSFPRCRTLYFPLLNYMSFLSARPQSTHYPINLHPVSASDMAVHTHPAQYLGSSVHILLCKILLLSLPSFLQPVLK